MPGEQQAQHVTTGITRGVPLYLIPKTIAEQIKKKGHSVFQIHVERGLHHSYTISVETFDEHAARVKQEMAATEEGGGHD